MTKRDILTNTSFGKRIAEEEAKDLGQYFVQTEVWRSIERGEVDIVYGAKGSGKSAIYAHLLRRNDERKLANTEVIAAENPRGDTAFKGLAIDPPSSEEEFRSLWKCYLLVLLGKELHKSGTDHPGAKKVVDYLTEAELLQEEGLGALINGVVRFVRSIFRPESVEGTVKLDPYSGLPTGVAGKISFADPEPKARRDGVLSVDALLDLADQYFAQENIPLWVAFDRLDVAFPEKPELEQNALRALFKVYLDIQRLEAVRLKIFLRSDIWSRITSEGFREASHITRATTIEWEPRSLMNLVVRRLLNNEAIRKSYNAAEGITLADYDRQEDLFYQVFPAKVESGDKKPRTFDWMLKRVSDGTEHPAPRELIHLLTETRTVQLRKYERGEPEPLDTNIVDGASLKAALVEVSKVRLAQTLYAEYPHLKSLIQRFESEKTEQSVATLVKLWDCDERTALANTQKLVEIGFFQQKGKGNDATFWVPFLYRDGLDMVQGKAEE